MGDCCARMDVGVATPDVARCRVPVGRWAITPIADEVIGNDDVGVRVAAGAARIDRVATTGELIVVDRDVGDGAPLRGEEDGGIRGIPGVNGVVFYINVACRA